MGKLRHLEICSEEPFRTADTLKEVVGLTEIRRDEEVGFVVLTDGYMHISVTRLDGDRAADGSGTAFAGVHHLGFVVDDMVEAQRAAADARCTEPESSTPFNRMYLAAGPFRFEVRDQGWHSVIRTHTQLYELTAAGDEPTTTRLALSGNVVPLANVPPGAAVCVEVDDVPVLVVRDGDDLYAVEDICPHTRYGRLSEGTREGNVVSCPIHGSKFDVTCGKVLTPPAKRDLTSYEVRIEDQTVVVTAKPDR